ncbi:hypothetical protein Poli38472_014705 [Pythium oligandrum]|uniref:RRM domain-containing protein n=1 Tax=Pythium oligandrum TaxID=41045 RepID=A0A8K1CIT6_PYTOL|nr:hypothetical protein Poli38472_014705 [Pythium oligandrum]|eukprot:TMW64000.1 hypothetical protein Poli38472_014705 [Pythium oligandrum]
MTADGGAVRMYIGGLAADVTPQELQERFGRIAASAQCRLQSVELPADRLTPSQSRGFAYLTIVGANAASVLEQIAKAYHRTKWRGSVLRVEAAKPDFQARLASEWAVVKAAEDARRARVEAERQRLLPVVVAEDEQVEVHTGVAFEGKKRTTFDAAALEELEVQMATDDDASEEDAPMHEESDVDEEEEEEDDQEEDEEEEEEEDESSSESDSESSELAPPSPIATPMPSATIKSTDAVPEDPNARRLAALQEKLKKKQSDAALAKGFVGKIDVVGGGKKITFDDDGEAQEENDDRDADEGTSSHRGRVTNWLDSDDEEEAEPSANEGYGELDDEKRLASEHQAAGVTSKRRTLAFDDDEGADGEGEAKDWFAVRPEFLGPRGKQLFELQKRFGGDQRFRMDARFIEDEENEYGGNQDIVDDDEALLEEETEDIAAIQSFQAEDIGDQLERFAQEMAQEQEQALEVIGELFPDLNLDKIRSRIAAQQKKDPIKDASWMGRMMRYDPRMANSSRYELSMDDGDKRKKLALDAEAETARLAEEKKKREEKEVLVGGDRFYATSNALGGLFTRVRKNSEDGMEGEAALDGVFGFSRTMEKESSQADETGEAATPSAFKLSSLFDFSFGDENKDEKKSLAAMGADLLEDDEDDEGKKAPWHFTQSFLRGDKDEREDEGMLTDKEEEDDEEEEDNEEDGDATTPKKKKTFVKRSLGEFLAFGRSFVGSAATRTAEEQDEWQKQWLERRKKLTLDFKRKRRDALKFKKKQQQAMQRQHLKRQKTR